jgi:FtsP/CotA-like multicopper oxidase with cupredoxin domain
MTKHAQVQSFSRRRFFRRAGGTAIAAAGMGLVPPPFRRLLAPVGVVEAQTSYPPPDLFWAGTDGFISLPPTPMIGSPSNPFHPDLNAPAPFTTYIFGFRNVTGLDPVQLANQKNKAQHTAPIFWVNEGTEFRMQLTNLGLALRPDLFDAHTIHWHGFRNVITFFDGEPTGSVAVTTGRNFQYIYRPHDPGTYMYHCHVEDVEHVHMGMNGPVFVRPLQNGSTALRSLGTARAAPNNKPFTGFAYNDGDGSTGYDREFAMQLSEIWAEAHWADAHIQLPEWSDYRADFALINGRVYPDTLAPNGSIDPFNPVRDPSGDLIPPAGHPELQYQPLSALVTCNAGESVLLRFANLGFRESAMTLAGITMKVVGKDATPMRGRNALIGSNPLDPYPRNGVDTSYAASTVSIGAGESADVIFVAPALRSPRPAGDPGYDTYVLYNRAYSRSNNLGGGGGFGGQRTEVRVYAGGTLPAQTIPNT